MILSFLFCWFYYVVKLLLLSMELLAVLDGDIKYFFHTSNFTDFEFIFVNRAWFAERFLTVSTICAIHGVLQIFSLTWSISLLHFLQTWLRRHLFFACQNVWQFWHLIGVRTWSLTCRFKYPALIVFGISGQSEC